MRNFNINIGLNNYINNLCLKEAISNAKQKADVGKNLSLCEYSQTFIFLTITNTKHYIEFGTTANDSHIMYSMSATSLERASEGHCKVWQVVICQLQPEAKSWARPGQNFGLSWLLAQPGF